MILLVLISLAATGWFSYLYLHPRQSRDILSLSRPHLDIFLLIDQSGSMKGDKQDPIPSDPEGIRVQAAQYFVDYLQYFSDPKARNRISIINFGTDAPDAYQLPLTEMNSLENIKRIKEMIQTYSFGYTNFLQALTKVRDYFKNAIVPGENRKPVVIIFTDGRPQDQRSLTHAQYFQELTAFIEKNLKNISVDKTARTVHFDFFIIALDAKGAYWPKDRNFWERVAPQQTYHLKVANAEELEGIYGKIIETIFTAQAGEWQDLESGRQHKVTVPPYVEKVVISVKKDIRIKTQELQIFNPKGERVLAGNKLIVNPSTGMNLYALLEPEAGEWTLSLIPSGKVRVKSDLLPTKLDIQKPRTVHPLGEPIELSALFLKSDGTPVSPLPHYPLAVSATVKMPDGQIIHPKIIPSGKQIGLYSGQSPLPARQEGVYDIHFEVNVGSFLKTGNFILTRNSLRTEVKPIVYFKSDAPSMRKSHAIYEILSFWKRSPFRIEGQLYRNGQATAAEVFALGKKDEIILAQIETERGDTVSQVGFLKYDPQKNRFYGTLEPDKHLAPGPYRLFTKTDLAQTNGDHTVREDYNPFRVTYGWGVIGWIIIAYLIFYALLQILWWMARGPLRGQLYINGTPLPSRLSNFLMLNKARIVSRKQKRVIPWFNTLRHDGDKNSPQICPTFSVIGDRYKAKGRGMEPALLVYHRLLYVIPWWTKLYPGRNTTSIKGFSIRWQP